MLERQINEGVEERLPVVPGLRVDISPSLGAPERGVIAERVFEVGERVFSVCGPILRSPTIYSFQLDESHHIDPIERDGRFGIGHYVNHSCSPTTGWGGIVIDEGRVGIQFVALRIIRPDEEITFDYATTEWDTVAKDSCRCGSSEGRGTLHGYRDLSQELRERYISMGIIPFYLLNQAEVESPQ